MLSGGLQLEAAFHVSRVSLLLSELFLVVGGRPLGADPAEHVVKSTSCCAFGGVVIGSWPVPLEPGADGEQIDSRMR
jgi:hypothetical protein